MVEYRARWVLPIASPPVKSGSVFVHEGRIVSIGSDESPATKHTITARIDLGSVALMPGLVNAHTHLELSWLRGRIPATTTFPEWIRLVIKARRDEPESDRPAVRDAIVRAIEEAGRTGTILIGDIGNTSQSLGPLAASSLDAVVFRELIGFNPPDADALVRQTWNDLSSRTGTEKVRLSLAAHAPYSVAPALFRAIRGELERRPGVPSSVHLGESEDETEFLMKGQGAWRRLLDDMGAWNADWRPPGCGPAEYVDSLGFLSSTTLVVHGVHLKRPGLELLASRGATLVTCPRGNLRTGAGSPPVSDFVTSGVRLAVGTDSLASVDDLEMFAEVAALRRLAPDVAPGLLLEAATAGGARALGFDRDYGTLEPGRRAEMIAIDVPGLVDDVEEYLVGGVQPEHVHWAEDLAREQGVANRN